MSLTLASSAKEREVERGRLLHLRDLLFELGRGFAFVGSQVPLEVGAQTFYLDLLFYHVRFRCYFVIELKIGSFKPEYAGKLNLYLSAADDLLRIFPGCTDAWTSSLRKPGRIHHRGICFAGHSETDRGFDLPRNAPTTGAAAAEEPSIEELKHVVEKLRPEISELHAEQDSEHAS
jgi:hypothetical protein